MAHSIDVSEHMGVSKPSVSHAVKLLREGGFIVMNDDCTLHLTDLGREIAEKLYVRHQYFTERLTDAGVDTDTVEAKACKMEHTISDDSFRKLKGQEQKRARLQIPVIPNRARSKAPDLKWPGKRNG